jgi:glutamate 5-kinase
VARERTEQFDRILGNNEERVVMVHRDNLALTM